jgi:hypothetical protein
MDLHDVESSTDGVNVVAPAKIANATAAHTQRSDPREMIIQ